MKASTALSALAMAVIAIAAPADLVARGGRCNSGSVTNGKNVCCDSLLSIVTCSVFSNACSGSSSSWCCETDAPLGALINIQALNCVKVG